MLQKCLLMSLMLQGAAERRELTISGKSTIHWFTSMLVTIKCQIIKFNIKNKLCYNIERKDSSYF